MTQVYAVKIEDGVETGDIFPLYFSVTSPRVLARTSYVLLSPNPECSVPITDRKDLDFFLSVPILHPDTVEVTIENWAAFLFLQMHHASESTLYKSSNEAVRGYSQLTYRAPFGPYYFEARRKSGVYGILVMPAEGEKETVRKSNQVLFLKSPWGEDMLTRKSVIEYNRERIIVRRTASDSYLDLGLNSYSAWFRERLTPAQCFQIYVNKIGSIKFIADHFESGRRAKDQGRTLRVVTIFGFTYFESYDEQLVLTLEKDPVLGILRAIWYLILSMEGEGIDCSIMRDKWEIMTKQNILDRTDDPKFARDLVMNGINILKEFATHLT